MKQANMSDWVRGFYTLGGAIAQIAFGALPFVLGWEHTVGSRSAETFTLITPAGYAFSIWSVLFAGSLIFSIYQLARPSHEPLRRIGWLAGHAFWLNAIWETYVPFQGLDGVSLGVIGLTWVLLVVLLLRAAGDGEAGFIDRLFRAPLFALVGWLNAAAFVNILATSNFYGLPWIGSGALEPAILVLVAASLAASLVLSRLPSLSYFAAVAWALYAVHIATQARAEEVLPMLALGLMGAVAATLLASGLRVIRKPRA
ncbi:hypothetical protein [Maricaulis sp.]|uniref:hypothetical protein n=1 Tax=Maricaulis sp. TaxID=1486257 RepID=UPI0026249EDC|nr:hypothetical protein [Maricaulis sp.]